MSEGTTPGPALLQQLLNREPLTPEQAEALMQAWLREELPPALAGGILVALQAKGVTAEELAAMAQVVQRQAVGADLTEIPPCLDTCGTGGDGAGTFNISTAVAFVAAAAGGTGSQTRESLSIQSGGFGGCIRSSGVAPTTGGGTGGGRTSGSRNYVFVCAWVASGDEGGGGSAANVENSHGV
jgi:hypothetical protein